MGNLTRKFMRSSIIALALISATYAVAEQQSVTHINLHDGTAIYLQEDLTIDEGLYIEMVLSPAGQDENDFQSETRCHFEGTVRDLPALHGFLIGCMHQIQWMQMQRAQEGRPSERVSLLVLGDFSTDEIAPFIEAYFDTPSWDDSSPSFSFSEEPLMQFERCTTPLHEERPWILANDNTSSFYALALSPDDQDNIRYIVRAMGKDNLVQLAWNKGTLEKKGKKIEHVHPMRFIGYILSQHDLRESLRKIRKSSFKWDHFIGGFF